MRFEDEDEQDFWMDCILTMLGKHAGSIPFNDVVLLADRAVLELRSRVPPFYEVGREEAPS